jgi:pSer/pThr/pTyr-binding forkhead associated (FHA) protein
LVRWFHWCPQLGLLLFSAREAYLETGRLMRPGLRVRRQGASVKIANRPMDFALPKNKTITISVIGGPSKGLAHQCSKPRISIGRAGGGADIEIDDPNVSGVHCAVGVKQDGVRLCDLDSTNGTYVNDLRVGFAELEHLSEIRVGSSLLLVMILPKPVMCTS